MISAVVFIFWPEEESYVETCFKTLDFVDEIVVIDNGATQKTVKVAKKFAAKIVQSKLTDFSERHNLAVAHVKGDWVLFIDADERVSRDLKMEILGVVSTDDPRSAFRLRRVNYFLGKEVKFGDHYPDLVTRLFRKNQLIGWTGEIHESSNVNGETGDLSAPLFHLTHRDIYSMMEKTINFSEHEANLRLKSSHPPVVWWRLLRVILGEAYYRIVTLQGWRQGTEGWIDGLFQSFSLFVVYARLWEMQRSESLYETYLKIDKKIVDEFK